LGPRAPRYDEQKHRMAQNSTHWWVIFIKVFDI